MKLLLTCFSLCFIVSLSHTQPLISSNKGISPGELEIANKQPATLVLQKSVLNNPAALSAFVRQNDAYRKQVSPPASKSSSRVLAGAGCADSSFVKLAGIIDNALYVFSIIHTKDDGALIAGSGHSATATPYGWQQYGVLIKTDNMGNILWTKYYKDEQNRPRYEIQLSLVTELKNGDIFTVSSLDTAQGNTSDDATHHHLLLTRLSATGNVLWYKTFNTTLSVENRWIPVDVNAVAEAANGDLVLGGTSMFSNGLALLETVVRMDGNGNKIWDAVFDKTNDDRYQTEGVGIFLENGRIILAGIEYGVNDVYNLVNSVHFLTLDYNTGAVIEKKSFTPPYLDDAGQYKNLTHYFANCIKLINGHYLLWGQTYSAFSQLRSPIDYFAVIEFDASFNVVDAYTISGTTQTNYYGDMLYFNIDGRGLFRLYSNPQSTIFEGSIYKKQLRKERAKSYTNISTGLNASFGPNQLFCFFNDSSYLHATSYFEDYLFTNSYLQFRKLHDSDTSSLCLGFDSITVDVLPYLVSQDATVIAEPPLLNKLKPTDVRVLFTDDNNFRYKNPCEQKSYCDSIKIKGDTIICGTQQQRIFTTYKNPFCGSFTEWLIDTSVVVSMKQVNDTSVIILFKDVNWNGRIYASLSTGQCSIPIIDSLPLHLVKGSKPVSLGDTLQICAGSSRILHAGNDFATYSWQDGSTDSLLPVNLPGKYYITTKDYCGNVSSDTVIIVTANYDFSLGQDTIKCNSDSIKLTVPPGFTNYRWSPAYNIVQENDTVVSVFPSSDTHYILKAEKMGGCIISDTIHIKVLHAPGINLGKDTSFCEGQQVTLDAGTGFSLYSWNNGASQQLITVGNAGSYIIKAMYPNGCYSTDTLNVQSVSPLPTFSLGLSNDTLLCDNQTLRYQFNLPGAYLWNDGIASANNAFTKPGLVWLRVTEKGCSFTDSINLLYQPTPLINLGNDTVICAGSVKLLDASYPNGSYTWQDGSTNAGVEVRSPGSYAVKVSLNGCSASDTVVIGYRSRPSFSLGADRFICEGQQLLLQPEIIAGADYRWQDGSTNPSYTVTAAGIYNLTITNTCGVGSSRVDLQACKLEYSIVSPK